MSGRFIPAQSSGSRALRRGNRGRGWIIGLGILAGLIAAQPPANLPGGRIVYIATDGESGDFDLYYIDLDDGLDEEEREPQLLFGTPEIEAEPDWSPDGSRIVFTSGDDIARLDISEDGSPGGLVWLTDTPGITELGPVYSPVCQNFSGASCRNWIAFSSDDGIDQFDLYLMDENGGDVIQLTNDPWSNWWPTWSPDGRKLAFMSDRSGSGLFDIFVLDIGSGQIRQMTDTPNNEDFWPAWSPDGDTIAWVTDMETGWFRVWLMDADCTSGFCDEEARLLIDDDFEFGVHEFDPAWSPNGQWVMLATYRDPEDEFGTQFDYELFAAQVHGPGLVQITYNEFRDDFTPAWAP